MHSGPSLRSSLLRLVGAAENVVTVARVRRKIARGTLEPVELVAHRGYGTGEVLRGQVRVLEARGVTPGAVDDAWWRNIGAAYRRFLSSEVPGAVVRARVDDTSLEVAADVGGYVRFELPNTRPDARGWRDVDLELVGPLGAGQQELRGTAQVLVPDLRAGVGIISDIDDTILRTGLTERAGMLRTTLLHNAATRLPYPGVAAFYRALQAGDGTATQPIFYVSGSPWNLYDMIVRFMELQGIPAGPLFLKDWGIDAHKFIREDTHAYKLARITMLLELYPELDYVLIGDSGQQDPEIYADVITRWRDRVRVVYIRDVTNHGTRDDAVRRLLGTLDEYEVPSVFGASTLSAATDAAERGLIAADRFDEIRRDSEEDRVRRIG
ncbi:MAG TPA: phosphatase domain-containing protein [Euzebyales bacterium]|nr:phosphatase domain-containing protein [Euzebyales bacterium]